MKYNRSNIEDTARVARTSAKSWNQPQYVFCTAFGYKISNQKPSFNQAYDRFMPDGRVDRFEYSFQNHNWTNVTVR